MSLKDYNTKQLQIAYRVACVTNQPIERVLVEVVAPIFRELKIRGEV